MRIELVTEGGFAALPGLNRPMVLDCATLPQAEAAQCERLARELAAAPGPSAAPSALRDGRRYRLTLHFGERSVTCVAADQAMSGPFHELLQIVKAHGHR
ncbi:protealysin inhibitor emfourin [Pseudoduganella chitinolytica]|uniref:Type II toxin-antitoxin system RelE/ParE family toxin n=1 Tax=Pseudoduganella chitinolytica TaxID=34070 RepID=A0ABY8BER1_9BURK|nr:protealysin inhibitor emfourin [Pseudoduganella chitinolytica]WEF34382.1 hypothetical protein PX653_06300 [Pseudoduganella chitinolytica]